MDPPDELNDNSTGNSLMDVDYKPVISVIQNKSCSSIPVEEHKFIETDGKFSHLSHTLTSITEPSSSSDLISTQSSQSSIGKSILGKEISFESDDTEMVDLDINFHSPETLREKAVQIDTVSCSPNVGEQRSCSSFSKFCNKYSIKSPELSSSSTDSSTDSEFTNCLTLKNKSDRTPFLCESEFVKHEKSFSFEEENKLMKNEQINTNSFKTNDCLIDKNSKSVSECDIHKKVGIMLDNSAEDLSSSDKLNDTDLSSTDLSIPNVKEQSNTEILIENEVQKIQSRLNVDNYESTSPEHSFKNVLKSSSNAVSLESKFLEERSQPVSLFSYNTKSELITTQDSSKTVTERLSDKTHGKDIFSEPKNSDSSSNDSIIDFCKDSVQSFLDNDDNIHAIAENISVNADNKTVGNLLYESNQVYDSDLSLRLEDSSDRSDYEMQLDKIKDNDQVKVKENFKNIETNKTEDNNTEMANSPSEDCHLMKNSENNQLIPETKFINMNEYSHQINDSKINKLLAESKPIQMNENNTESKFFSKFNVGNVSFHTKHDDTCSLIPSLELQKFKEIEKDKVLSEELDFENFSSIKSDASISDSHSNQVLVRTVSKAEIQFSHPESSTEKIKSNINIKNTEDSECKVEDITCETSLKAEIPKIVEHFESEESISRKINKDIVHSNPLEDSLILQNIDESLTDTNSDQITCQSIKENTYKNDFNLNIKDNQSVDGLQDSLITTNFSQEISSEEASSGKVINESKGFACSSDDTRNILEKVVPLNRNMEVSNFSQDVLIASNSESHTTFSKKELSLKKSPSVVSHDFSSMSDLINESEDIQMKSSSIEDVLDCEASNVSVPDTVADTLHTESKNSTKLVENAETSKISRKFELINESEDIEMKSSFIEDDLSIKSLTTLTRHDTVTDTLLTESKNFTKHIGNKETLNTLEKPEVSDATKAINLPVDAVLGSTGINSSEHLILAKKECHDNECLGEMLQSKELSSEESLDSLEPLCIPIENENLSDEKADESLFDEISNISNANTTGNKITPLESEYKDVQPSRTDCEIDCCMQNYKNTCNETEDMTASQVSTITSTTEELSELKDSSKITINDNFKTSVNNFSFDTISNEVDLDLTAKQTLSFQIETNMGKKEYSNVSGEVDTQEEFLSKENFDWDHYLEKNNSETAPPTAFLHVERSLETGVHVNQVLEVLFTADENNLTDSSLIWTSYWPAKVVSSCGSLLRLKFIISSRVTQVNVPLDFWCDLSSPKIKPIGWSKEKGIPMCPPPEIHTEEGSTLDEALRALQPVPEEAFETENRELFNRIPEGIYLEVLDSHDLYTGMIVKVLKNVGGRLLMSIIEEDGLDILDKNPFWLYFLDKRIRPLKWIQNQGERFRYKYCDIENFLKICDNCTPEKTVSFLSSLNTLFSKHDIEEGMKMEAFHPVTLQSIHAAVVSKVVSDIQFEIKIDDHSWVTTIDDPLIVPCGFSDENCLDLVPLKNYSQEPPCSNNITSTNSGSTLSKTFPKHSLCSELGFEVGQKLEVASPLDPDHICIATIERVLQHILLLKLDSNPEFNFYRAANSMDNFPPGWAHSHSYPLAVPYWYVKLSRNPSIINQNEENEILPDSNLGVSGDKSPWTKYNPLWCPRLFINHCCNPGPYLSKTKVSKMSQSVGPGPLPLVLHDIISMTINAAYIPTRVLRELQNLKKMHSSWQSISVKAKFKRHILKAGVNIPSVGGDIPFFLMEFSRILMSCQNLWSFDNIGENCPSICNKQNLSTISSGTSICRGRGGIRGSIFRRKKGGKKRLFYPIKSSANNNEDNTEEFCYPDEGEEVEEVNSESEGESRPSSPASTDVQRKVKPKRILSSLEITMNDCRSSDIIKERSTKRSRGDFDAEILSQQQTAPCLRTVEDPSSDRKKARIEEEKEETEEEAVIYGLETAQVDSDPLDWSIDDVERYVSSQPDISHHAVKLKEQEVDGRALLLLNLPSLIHHMGLPHSVAVTLAQHICKVKMAHFVNYYPKYSKNVM